MSGEPTKHKKENVKITCKDCAIQYKKGDWKSHVKDEKHKKAVVKKQQLKDEHENERLICKFCNEEYVRKNLEEHKKTPKHREAHQQRYIDCNDCNERCMKKDWKEHTKSEKHKLFKQKKDNKKKENLSQKKEKEKYEARQILRENEQYVNALAAFLLLRYTFECKDFKLSVYNDEWKQFGDIVIEDDEKIKAIRCKKVQSRHSYSLADLYVESRKLSIKEQVEILETLKTGNCYSKTTAFCLHTISNLSIEVKQFTYDNAIVANWKDGQVLWEGRTVEIEQEKRSEERDLLNTNDDTEDIFFVRVIERKFQEDAQKRKESKESTDDSEVIERKLQIHINQKDGMELKSAIHSMLEDTFGTVKNISDGVVRYVNDCFMARKEKNYYKMTRDDVLAKIAELLLRPYWVLPEGIIPEKEIDLWQKTLKNFDFVVMKNNCEVIRKLYTSINYIFKVETKNIFSADDSARFNYLTLWKNGLVPLILAPENENQLTLILKVIDVLKSEHSSCLQFIILTDMKLDYSDKLNAFVTGEDLRLLDRKDFQDVLTATKINYLNFEILLKEIVSYNADFLEKLTPDTLLNMFLGEFSFSDVLASGSEENVEYTLALDTETMTKSEIYFQGRDYEVAEQSGQLSYSISVEGKPTRVRVPPEI